MMMTEQQTNPEVLRLIEAMERVADDLQALSDRIAEPAGELSDAQIMDALNGTSMKFQADCGYPAPRNLVALARAVIAADRALQASHIAVLATDGWKLVPLEPTAEMLQAGQDAPVSESDEDAPEDYKAVYRAMLAAAPRHHQADDVCQNRTLRGGTLIDMVRDVEKHHGIGGEPQQIAGLDKDAEIERLKDALTFVERWANHHAQKPHVTAAEALSCIQHYPEIEAITESYADGKVPETRDPYAEIAALQQEVDNALALWTVAHAERSEAMIHGAMLDAEITALKAERDALRKDAEWYDCKGWYAIEEVDLDADMQAQAVKSS